jgi:hypothetical protein
LLLWSPPSVTQAASDPASSAIARNFADAPNTGPSSGSSTSPMTSLPGDEMKFAIQLSTQMKAGKQIGPADTEKR